MALKWHYISEEGKPTKAGSYLVALCRKQADGEFSKGLKPVLRTLDLFWFGNTPGGPQLMWCMPSAWSESEIYAWAEEPEVPPVPEK